MDGWKGRAMSKAYEIPVLKNEVETNNNDIIFYIGNVPYIIINSGIEDFLIREYELFKESFDKRKRLTKNKKSV